MVNVHLFTTSHCGDGDGSKGGVGRFGYWMVGDPIGVGCKMWWQEAGWVGGEEVWPEKG